MVDLVLFWCTYRYSRSASAGWLVAVEQICDTRLDEVFDKQ